MDPIKLQEIPVIERLQDIPEIDIFNYFICYTCNRIIREGDIAQHQRCQISVNGDSSILKECKQCFDRRMEEFDKELRQQRIKNMQYYLDRLNERMI